MTIALLADLLLALLLLLWAGFLLRLTRYVRQAIKGQGELALLSGHFLQSLLAAREAAQDLKERLMAAEKLYRDERQKASLLIGDLQQAHDDLRREIARSRQATGQR